MLSLTSLSATSFAGAAVATPRAVVQMETAADLKSLADKLNPVVGFWDPMNLAEYDQWSAGEAATVGFLRHAEIKHGRVAMAAFVGYIVQSNGIHFPWALTTSGVTYEQISAAGSPPEQWDALPTAAKVQIILGVGFLEICSESNYILSQSGGKHYMSGGDPGRFPSLKGVMPHPVPLDLWDPFGVTKNNPPEKKAKGLLAEINNGRLAMVGIMGFLAEQKVPGSVPALGAVGLPSYGGEVMAPFAASDSSLPFVSDMLNFGSPF